VGTSDFQLQFILRHFTVNTGKAMVIQWRGVPGVVVHRRARVICTIAAAEALQCLCTAAKHSALRKLLRRRIPSP